MEGIFASTQNLEMIKKISAGDQELPDGEGAEMGFLEHLDELRGTIISSIKAIAVFAVLALTFSRYVWDHVIFAPLSKDFVTFKLFCDKLGICFEVSDFQIKTVELTESFFMDLKVSFFIGLILAFPYIFYKFWCFVKPGLYQKEQKVTKGVVFTCSLLFFSGIAFGYFILTPFAIKFFAGYSVSAMVDTEVSVAKLVSHLTVFIFPSGIMFQLPLVIYFLSKLGLVTDESMKAYRKHAFVAILIAAAILTPPDVLTQFMIGIPIYGLYEASIIIARRQAKKLEKELNS